MMEGGMRKTDKVIRWILTGGMLVGTMKSGRCLCVAEFRADT